MTLHFDYCPIASERDNYSEGSSVPVVRRWVWSGNRTFQKVASLMVTFWIVAFLHSGSKQLMLLILE